MSTKQDNAFFRTCIVVTSVLALIMAVFAASYTTEYATELIESRNIGSASNIPKTWPITHSDKISAEATIDSRVVEGEYIQYLISVSNTGIDNGFYIKNLAVYLAESGEQTGGFLNLGEESLEYTYNPSDPDSWEHIFLTRPSNLENAFRLANNVFVGWSGSETDTVYFRFYVAPRADDAEVSAKVSLLVQPGVSDEVSLVENSNTIAYHYEAAPTTSDEQIAMVDSDEDYTAPLGVFSISPDAFVLFGTVSEDLSASLDFNPIWMIFAAISVILVGFLIYIPLAQKKK